MTENQVQELIKNKWIELETSRELIRKYCKSIRSGGILVVKYEDSISKNPTVCFIKDDPTSEIWIEFAKSIENFKELYNGYNIELHYIVFVTINISNRNYGQLARLNY